MKNRIKGGGGLSRKLLAILVTSGMLSSGAMANDVYIEQAGDTSTFNITQSGTGGNRVGSAGTPSTFSANNQTIDIVQAGQGNEADLTVSGGSTTINYSATGDMNQLKVEIDGGTGNTFNIAKDGDSNRVTVCGTNNVGTSGQTGATASCTSGVTVNDTTNTINVTGGSNKVNLALASADAVNTINIGHNSQGVAGSPSSGNIVNVTQSSSGIPTTNITVNGDTNTINVKQQ
jgi:hypothetical protein